MKNHLKDLVAGFKSIFNISGKTQKPDFLNKSDHEAISNDWQELKKDFYQTHKRIR